MGGIQKFSELLLIPDLSDIHLFNPTTESTTLTAITRIAGNLSESQTIEADIPEILNTQGGIQVNIGDKALRLRITPSKSLGCSMLFIRVMPNTPPSIATVSAKYFFRNIHDRESLGAGLILVSGKAGSGKSTYIASILQHCISCFPVHVVSIEDPVEYVLNPQKGYATQKEISFSSTSFGSALRACMREDPDILFIGEVRDRETAETALSAAESGHLVFGTIHAGSNAGIVDRLMGLIGGSNSEYTALRISQCLRMCLSVKRNEMSFEYVYAEISESLRTVIRNQALHQWGLYASEITRKGELGWK